MLALLLLIISLIDLLSHRIPNKLLYILSILALYENALTFNLMGAFCAAIIGALALQLADIGAGDVKLFFIVALLVIPQGEMLAYLSGISISALLLLVVHFLVMRSFTGRIAFAPALCGGVLATSLY